MLVCEGRHVVQDQLLDRDSRTRAEPFAFLVLSLSRGAGRGFRWVARRGGQALAEEIPRQLAAAQLQRPQRWREDLAAGQASQV